MNSPLCADQTQEPHDSDKVISAAGDPFSQDCSPKDVAPADRQLGGTLLASAGLGFILGAAVWRGPIYSLEIAQVAAGTVALPTTDPIYAHHTSIISPFH